MSSLVFVVSSLEAIQASKECQKNKQLADLTEQALKAIKESASEASAKQPDPNVIFAPLQLATKTGSSQLTNTALDCIGKLISSSYLTAGAFQQDGTEQVPLIDRAIDTICDSFQGETTAVDVQRHIVQALLAAVLNDKIVVHGAGLLKAVRQVYNVFLLSRSSDTQQAAQGTLTQMVGMVFERVRTRLHMKEARLNLSRINSSSNVTFEAPDSDSVTATATTQANGTGNGDSSNGDEQQQALTEPKPATDGASDSETAPSEVTSGSQQEQVEQSDGPKLTLKDLEHRKSFDDSNLGDGPTMVTQLRPKKSPPSSSDHTENNPSESVAEESAESQDAVDEVYIRDAYLVFRSFCNLSTKALQGELLYDIRGQPMRSKLISLHLIRTLLNNHIHVFTSPYCTITNSKSKESTSFLQAIKFYLCLSITRNGASSVDRVFEVCCEIFWLMLKFMRAPFKKEIEVFLNEIYLALLARRTAPLNQKLYFVNVLNRLCADPRGLVETYLNYDCDGNVANIFQTIIEDLSKFASAPVAVTSTLEQMYEEKAAVSATNAEWQLKGMLPPPLTVVHIAPPNEADSEVPKEYVMKRVALDSLVDALRSLVNWSSVGRSAAEGSSPEGEARRSTDDIRESLDPSLNDNTSRFDTPLPSTPVINDDPAQLEKEKARKTAVSNAIRVFNEKPKRGMKLLLSGGFIPSDNPQDIATFLLTNDRLDKASLGTFLGEGDPKSVEIMHAFVDKMDFNKTRFVDALRQFLQSFRLPGEAQKIDRFMLKFANRYLTGNPNAFANADTAYVLAYSVIMLNTDLHSSRMKDKRMTKQDFIKNNRGINDNADLPDEYLIGIYEEIAENEIVLKSERDAATAAGMPSTQQPSGFAAGLGLAFSNMGRDLQREAFVQQSEEIAIRSEQLFKDLFKNQRRNAAKAGIQFIPATSFRHVGPMFDVTWMSFFSALSSQMQKAQNLEVNRLCLEGMKQAVKVACLFELSTPREAFMSALKNATNLNNPQEALAKNIEALRAILELGQTEGNYLRQSWKDVLMCISQLERLQLISGGVDEGAIPDVSKARFMPPERSNSESRRSTVSSRNRNRSNPGSKGVSMEIATEIRSDEVNKSVDRIFSNTAFLNGDAIVHFATALTEVSWDEIKVSGSNDSPRTYSLQKIVEISYYNMTRVRFEWTNIWAVLGEHFNKVGCHSNINIVYFALDSLKQLSIRFMEIEELPGFKFQKDFLKPFEHVMANSTNLTVKDLALRCLVHMIEARGENIRSGWRTMFGAFTVAARDLNESIVTLAYDNVLVVYRTRFGVVISQGAFTDLIVCLTEFSKNTKFQKKSLQAMETLKSIIPRMLKAPECPLSQKYLATAGQDGKSAETTTQRKPGDTSVEEGFWFPILFAFHDVLMTGEDLEVRSNALNYFFDALLKYGGDFPSDFWDILWRQQLYPIFMVLRSRPELSNALNHEELSVWLSTTMIQALRNMIVLFTHYFDALEYMLDRFLELLALCICQENDTIARIGSNCLQQLILQNVTKFNNEHWSRVVRAFCELFERTTAYQLFSPTTINVPASISTPTEGLGFQVPLTPTEESPDPNPLKINGTDSHGPIPESDSSALSIPPTPDPENDPLKTPTAASPSAATAAPLEDYRPSNSLQQQPIVVTAARRRLFNQIISRCVLQLLMIETVSELFSNDSVYAQIPSTELLRLMALLKKSFLFARRFNNDKELRMRLWREGFMKQPPNLLKQESGSAATYIQILFRMFADTSASRADSRPEVERALVPLCKDVIRGYLALEEESQQRNIMAWRPVVVDVLEGYAAWPELEFQKHVPSFYLLAIELLAKDLSADLRMALLAVLRRIGCVCLGVEVVKAAVRRESVVGNVGVGVGVGEHDAQGVVEGGAGEVGDGDGGLRG